MAEKKFDNVKINVGFSEEQELKELKSGEGLSALMGKLAKAVKDIISHIADGVKHISATERANWNGKANGTHGHSAVSQSAAGFMSADDKKKLDGIAENANNYSLPVASVSILGGVKVGDNLSIATDGTLSAPIYSMSNFADNPDFKINQRGLLTVTNGYAADRWTGTYTVDDTGILMGASGLCCQRYEHAWFKQLSGSIMTASISVDGVIHSGTAYVKPYNGGWTDTDDFMLNPFLVDIVYNPEIVQLRIMNNSGVEHHIEWAKLEPGECATPFVPPNPALELLKCQRYLQPVIIDGINYNDSRPGKANPVFKHNLNPIMRATPSMVNPECLCYDKDYGAGVWQFDGTFTSKNSKDHISIICTLPDTVQADDCHKCRIFSGKTSAPGTLIPLLLSAEL